MDQSHFITKRSQLQQRLTSPASEVQPDQENLSTPFNMAVDQASRTLCALLKDRTGYDFAFYKTSIIRRQVMRRMIATDCWQVYDYLAYLNQHPAEIQSLANKLLNGFTAFFRDGAAFEFLANAVFPVLFKNKQENAAIRVWVPGCATGEEAYSLAILFQEHLAKFEQSTGTKIEILATDINLQAIRVARRGLYPRTITAHLSDHYLNHYFDEVEAGYQVKPHLRDMICFVSRSLVRSPATYGVNLISCRNLLIYFKPEFQQMALTCFYEHLEEKGFLFLGGSESVGTASDLFSVIDAKWCVFQRKEGLLPLPSFPICSLSVNE